MIRKIQKNIIYAIDCDMDGPKGFMLQHPQLFIDMSGSSNPTLPLSKTYVEDIEKKAFRNGYVTQEFSNFGDFAKWCKEMQPKGFIHDPMGPTKTVQLQSFNQSKIDTTMYKLTVVGVLATVIMLVLTYLK